MWCPSLACNGQISIPTSAVLNGSSGRYISAQFTVVAVGELFSKGNYVVDSSVAWQIDKTVYELGIG